MNEILKVIVDFFSNAGSLIGADMVTLIAFGLTLFAFLISVIVVVNSVESKTNRKVKEINKYLTNNPFVNDENIVEFNRIMKNKIPRAMRYQWQRYMVNRNDKPSKYLSEENCLTKPFKTSAFAQVLKQLKYVVGFIVVANVAFSLGAIYSEVYSVTKALLYTSASSLVIIGATVFFLFLLNARRNSTLNDVAYNFDNMQHLLDRAVTTFPAFVDYEILFTRKEIMAGIPALQEYLQQRAEYEQEQLEKARQSQVEHEKYDFSKLGGKGTIIMERAMKECEFYLGNRKILMADIDAVQTQKDLLTKNYEEKNRNNQRKLRDIKETIDRLREKLNNTTNKIVGNDLIKQQADEAKKQQLVEKEMEEDSKHYQEDLEKLELQISKKREEIEENRKNVEKTLTSDFMSYSDDIYDKLKDIAESQVKDELSTLKQDKLDLEQLLEDREQLIMEQAELQKELSVLEEYKEKIKEKDNMIDIRNQEIIGANREIESKSKQVKILEDEVARLKREKYHEIYRYFDNDGTEFFYDEKGNPYHLTKDGDKVYYSKEERIEKLKEYRNDLSQFDATEEMTHDVAEEVEEPVATEPVVEAEEPTEPVVEEPVVESVEEPVVEEVIEDVVVNEEPAVVESVVEEPVQEEPADAEPEAVKDEVEAKLDEEIQKQEEELQHSHENLQEHIESVEKEIIEPEVKEVEEVMEKETENKVKEPKPAKAKAETKPAKESAKDSKPKKKDKKGPAFKFKKSQSSDNSGFDLSAFDNLVDSDSKKGKK